MIRIEHDFSIAKIVSDIPNDLNILIDNKTKFHPKGYDKRWFFIKKRWDGFDHTYNTQDRIFRVGLLNRVKNVIKSTGEEVETVLIENNQLKSIDIQITSSGIKSLDYQIACRKVARDHNIGIIDSATGTGKSICMALMIDELKTKTLLLFNDLVLADQMHRNLTRYFPNNKIGYIGNSEFDLQDIIVATVQSLRSVMGIIEKKDKTVHKNKNEFEQWLRGVGMTIHDECFPYYTMVYTDQGPKYIGRLYNDWAKGAAMPKALSWNESSNQFEYKDIVGAIRKNSETIYRISTSSNKSIQCTGNHQLLTLDGWKAAEKLTTNDVLLGKILPQAKRRTGAYLCNDDQTQVFIGSYLGDGCVTAQHNKKCRIRIRHGHKQYLYNKFKASVFDIKKIKYIKHNGFSQKPANLFTTKELYIDGIEVNGDKSKIDLLPSTLLSKIDWRAIAIWYMDDGSVTKGKNGKISMSTLHTESFSHSVQLQLVELLKCMGIIANICHNKKKKLEYLSIGKESTLLLHKNISKYVHPLFKYKLDITTHNEVGTYIWDNKYKSISAFPVYNVEQIKNRLIRGKNHVYDLTIADTHTYLVSNKTASYNAIIAHNCHLSDSDSCVDIYDRFGHIPKRFGFSATPDEWSDKAVKNSNIELEQVFGRVIYNTDGVDFIQLGMRVQPVVRSIEVPANVKVYGNRFDDQGLLYKKALKFEILQDDKWLNTVQEIVKEYTSTGASVFVYAGHSIEYGEKLAKALDAPFVQGKTPRKERFRLFDAVQTKELLCIVSDIGGVGLDIPSLDTFVLASDVVDIRQMLGRVVRAYPGKTIGTFVDLYKDTSFLSSHYKKRLNQYEKLGAVHL